MQTGRSTTSQLKRYPTMSSTKASSKPSSNKVYSLIDSLHLQLTSSPPSSSQLTYFKHKIDDYRVKLMKLQPLKKAKKYYLKLQQCESILDIQSSQKQYPSSSQPTSSKSISIASPLQQHTRTESEYESSKYNSIEMDLLRSTVQSKECLLKQLYEKQKGKVKSYEDVIKQQQKEMDLVRNRLEELESNKQNKREGRGNKESDIQQSKNAEKKQVFREQNSKLTASISYNKQNVDSNASRMSNNSLIKQLILRNNQQSLSFDKTERTSRVSNRVENTKSSTFESSLLKQQQELISTLQNQVRVLLTGKQAFQISIQNKQKVIKSKEKQIQSNNQQIKQLKQKLRVKEEILTQLLYQKQNYSDAYLKLKEESYQLKQKLEQKQLMLQQQSMSSSQDFNQLFKQQLKVKQQQLIELEELVERTKQQLEQQKERNQGLTIALQKQQEKIQKLGAKYHQSEEQNKQVKLKLRTMQHKMEMYMEKYYRLQNQQIVESREKNDSRRDIVRDSRSFDRSQKLFTAGTYEMSCDREVEVAKGRDRSVFKQTGVSREREIERYREKERQRDRERYEDVSKSKEREVNRKRQVLSQIKSMVRERRNHLFQ